MRPTPSVVKLMQDLAGDNQILLMGVTPELHAAFNNIVAVDRDSGMIERVWPGNTVTKTVIQCDWMSIAWNDIPPITAVVGDCALPMLSNLDNMRIFQQNCYDKLESGGVFVQRLFMRPENPYTRDDLLKIMSEPAQINFHAFKWVMCMAIAAEFGYSMSDPQRYDYFNTLCNNREKLANDTGWGSDAIETIEMYCDGKQTIGFCDRAEIFNTIPIDAVDVKFLYTDDYDLAEHCPIVFWRKP